MNPKLKMKAEIEEKCRQKYEAKLKEAKEEFTRLLAEAHANYIVQLKMGIDRLDTKVYGGGITMDVREKLVELVDKARRYAADKCHSFMSCAECSHYGENDGNCRNAYIAESLVANGVTVQEWISVKDRLPEQGQEVIVYAGNILSPVVMAYKFWDKDFDTWLHVTHWMPLPNPPKEVDHES